MLLANAFLPDPRVLKEARSLARRGARITILAWDRENRYADREHISGLDIERIHLRSGFNRRMAQLPTIMLLWCRMIARGRKHRFDIIHCHDLDTLFPAIVLRLIARVPLIYDAHENYARVKSASLPALFVRLLDYAERRLIRFVDVIITASTVVGDEFRRVRRRPVITLGNYWSLDRRLEMTDEERAAGRRDLGIWPDDLLLGYIGGLKRSRKIEPLLKAIQGETGVSVLICGAGEQQGLVERAATDHAHVSYLGWIPLEEVSRYTALCDVIYYGLDNYPGAPYNSPNSLFMAMLQGRAVLVSDIGDLGRIVQEESCGLLLQETSEEEIRKALGQLRDRPFLRRLQENAYLAARRRYHWEKAEKILWNAYRHLLKRAAERTDG